MASKPKVAIYIIGAFLIIGASFGSGVYFGRHKEPQIEKILNIVSKEPQTPIKEIDFSPFWKSWAILEEKYVSKEKLDEKQMLYGAIQGLANSLKDPYTVFLPPEEKKFFESEIRGDFEGVGMEIGIKKGILTVIAPLKGTPAWNAGVKSGDKIFEINGEETRELTLDQAVKKIRGPKGTQVTLTIFREKTDETKKIAIIRDVIKIPTLETEIKGDVFIIRLFNFNQPAIFKFREALRELILSGKNKLIIDLRGNPGGYLEVAVDLTSFFLPMGKIVVQEDFGSGEIKVHRSVGYNIWENQRLVALVDKGSASASEIMAGALRDHKKAVLIGEKTFGKGSVQELVPITGDTSLKVTIAKWLTPNGHSISDEGLTPDIVVETKDGEDKDVILEKAIEYLSK